MATKFINLNNLATFLAKLKTLFVAKELKTGSTNTYKVLSDNNLTDELVAKIEERRRLHVLRRVHGPDRQACHRRQGDRQR